MKKLFISLLLALTIVQLQAQYDKLYKNFDADGILSFEFSDSTNSSAVAVTVQADGKMILAGKGLSNYFAMARFFPYGTLDGSFDENDKVLTDCIDVDYCTSKIIQPDDRINRVDRYNNTSRSIAHYQQA